ncbi:MAG TPA: hypothetical protein PKE47_01750 [Verrucomicrobiota bacterium]|nr:hypothetical protein [Verrucomicrobiota bacterium]
MKFTGRQDGRLCFTLSRAEHEMLRWLFSHFPLQDAGARSLCRRDDAGLRETNAWLREALAEERTALKQWLRGRFGAEPAGEGPVQLRIEPAEAERLLQTANELRIGAWQLLGCPENLDDPGGPETPERLQWQALLEMAGIVEMVLLAGLHGCGDASAGTEAA